MSAENIVDELQTVLEGVVGVRKVSDPPSMLNVFPYAVAYSRRGSQSKPAHNGAVKRGEHELVVELHFKADDLLRAVKEAGPYLESVSDAIFDSSTLNNTVQPIKEIFYEHGGMPQYGDFKTVGYLFTMTVFEQR